MLNPRKGALAFVFVTVLLDMLALGIIVPVLPKLILNFLGSNFANAALITGVFGTIFAVFQLVVSPILGVLSDKVGRRPIILLSNLGTGLDYIVMALAPSIGWLFLGRIISGITTSSISVASAYVADVTPADRRAGAFGMISACFGIGFVVGPAVGGLLGNIDPRFPFWGAAILSLVNFAYGLLVLPESLASENRNSFSWKRANPFGAFMLLRRHRELFGLSAVSFIGYIAHEALPTLFVLYTIYVFHWTLVTNGIALAVIGLTTIVVGAFVVQPVVNRIGERRSLAIGIFFSALGYAFFSGSQVFFWIGMIVMSFGMIASAAEQAIMTRRVANNQQGELQGAINMLRSLGSIFGPMVFSGVFAFSSSRWHLPSTAWWFGAALLFASMFVAWIVTKPSDDIAEPIDSSRAIEGALAQDNAIP
ncbi:MAG: TCR/Tet family MFS transporter [Candidatus Eremiobacteraeota bacterium]|nr:TCR/Tet family MFS transporter [Candidatus Eremiobacteraeota bacterium]